MKPYNGKTPLPRPSRMGRFDNVVYLDTETDSVWEEYDTERLTLKVGYAVHKRRNNKGGWTKGKWLRFTAIDPIADFLVSKVRENSALTVVAHNMDFDALICGFAKTLPERGFTAPNPIFGSGPYIVVYRNGKRRIKLVCSLNHLKSSLAALGDRFGKPKMEMPAADAPIEEWDVYGRNDVEVLAHVMERYTDWVYKRGFGTMQDTAPQQAYFAYRRLHMTTNLFPTANKIARRLSEKALYGGRTEMFWKGRSRRPGYYCDFNSAYPHVMREGWFPTRFVGNLRDPNSDRLRKWLRGHLLIAKVTIRAGDPDYPVHRDGRLQFRADRFTTYLADAEFRDAFGRGRIEQVHMASVFEKARIFRSWVDDLYPERQQAKEAGDVVSDYLLKLYLNSLFGKFGQKAYKSKVLGDCPPDELLSRHAISEKDGTRFHLRKYAGKAVLSWVQGTKNSAMPEIAACVTSEARLMLTRHIRAAGRKNVAYCDTDSLIVTPKGYERLGSPGRTADLGDLCLEAGPAHYEIRGLKNYTFGDKSRIKGVRDPDQIIDDMMYKDAQWSRTLGAIRDGDVCSVTIRHGRKVLTGEYTKGHAPRRSGFVRPLGG